MADVLGLGLGLNGLHINALPQEVLVKIMAELTLFQRKRMRLVCRYWNEISYDRSLILNDRITVPNVRDLALLAEGPNHRQFFSLLIKNVGLDDYLESDFWHKFGFSITQVDMMNIQNKGNRVFIDMFKHCVNLKVLRMYMDHTQGPNSSPEDNVFSDLRTNGSLTSIYIENSERVYLTDAELIALTRDSVGLKDIGLNMFAILGAPPFKYSTLCNLLNSQSSVITHLKLLDIGELNLKLSDIFSRIGNQLISLKIGLCSSHRIARETFNKVCERFPNLEVMELTDARFDEEGLKMVLSSCEKLEGVFLRQARVSDSVIREISHLSNLKQIDLYMCFGVTDNGLIAAFTQKTMPTLETLNLSYLKVSDEVIMEIAPMFPNLIRLDLDGAKVGDFGAWAIFTHNTKLRILSLANCKKLKDIFTGALSMNELKDLSELHIDGCSLIDGTSLENLRLKHLRKLRAFGAEGLSAAIRTFLASLDHLPRPWPRSFLANFIEACPSIESVGVSVDLQPPDIANLGLPPHARELLSF